MNAENLWANVARVRRDAPLVHNITNLVVTNNTANATLAVGASPIMSHAHSEVEAMVALCASVVVNIGTLDEYWVETMLRAAREASRLGRPWVFDPVGAGATPFRDEVSARLVESRPTAIRGNASEIMAVAAAVDSAALNPHASTPATKGVDSTASSGEAVEAARFLNRRFGSVVCVSGETDIVVDSARTLYIHNGSTMMTRVTGLGCSASAVIGAFIAGFSSSDENPFEAVCAATALFSVCGEIAAQEVAGPGSLQVALLDKLYNITEAEFLRQLKITTDH